MEIAGKVIQVLNEESGQGKTGNGWRKKLFILETPDQYPKKICIAIWGDKIDQLAVQENENLTVHFDVESREYMGKWYTDVKAWKVDRQGGNTSSANNTSTNNNNNIAAPVAPANFNEAPAIEDDLPF